MTDKLLPCPFCGGEARHYAPGPIDHHIECTNPKCYAVTHGWSTEAEAIAAWNTRADYHGYEQAAIEAWESIKAWNARAERTCEVVNVNGYAFRFECSECGYVAIVHNCETRLDELPKNCPNCGSRVIG